MRQALEMALEALEKADKIRGFPNNKKAITAIKEALVQPERDYERGFIDGMQKQMQSSVDKAVNAMTKPTYYIPSKDQRTWVGLTEEEFKKLIDDAGFTRSDLLMVGACVEQIVELVQAKLKEKNT